MAFRLFRPLSRRLNRQLILKSSSKTPLHGGVVSRFSTAAPTVKAVVSVSAAQGLRTLTPIAFGAAAGVGLVWISVNDVGCQGDKEFDDALTKEAIKDVDALVSDPKEEAKEKEVPKPADSKPEKEQDSKEKKHDNNNVDEKDKASKADNSVDAIETDGGKFSRDTLARYLGYGARLKIAFITGTKAAAKVVASNIRYAAYSSDFGEGLRPVLPASIVKLTYGLSVAYIIGDVGYHTKEEFDKGSSQIVVAKTFLETASFQLVASLAIPFALIHTAVKHSTTFFVKKGRFVKWGPSVVGLSMIPLMPLFDEPVEHAMHLLFNKLMPIKEEDKHTSDPISTTSDSNDSDTKEPSSV